MPEQINVIGKYKTKNAVAQPNRTATRYIVIHHAAWTYDPGEALQSIFTYHSSQWPQYGRIGYTEIIQEEMDGTLQRYLVNSYDMVGAGVWGRNPECVHICMARHNLNEIPPQHWIDETARAAADAKKRYPNAQIVGHGEIALPAHETSCPGSKWKAWKPAFVAQVDNLVKRAAPPPVPPKKRLYMARCTMPVLEARRLDAPIALGGQAELARGVIITVDDVTDGWAHLDNNVGFVPVYWLVPV